MATFKYSGSIRYADDTQLWKEILTKERGTSEMTRDFYSSDAFGGDTGISRFGSNKLERTRRNKTWVNNAMNDNLV